MVHQVPVDGAIPVISAIVADRVESLGHLIILYVRLIPIGRRRVGAFLAMTLANRGETRDRITNWTSA
jgi:hypothetical protein